MVTFAEPVWLWLLLAPPGCVAAALWRHRQRLRAQRRVASPGVWLRVMGGAPSTGRARMILWALAAALAVVAAARPQWGEVESLAPVVTRDLVVAMDVSASMRCPDVPPARLQRSVAVVQRALPLLEGNRVGAVVFAGDAYPLVPLTIDLAAAGTFLTSVSPEMVTLPGSNLERAVDSALELLPPEGVGRVVIVVSDGENLQGSVEAAAQRLSEAGVTAVGLLAGTENGGLIPEESSSGTSSYKRDPAGRPVVTRADRASLERLTEPTGGSVVELTSPSVVRDLVSLLSEIRAREVETSQSSRRVERYRLFVVAALVLAVSGFALSPWRRLHVAAATVLWVIGYGPFLGSALAAQPSSSEGVLNEPSGLVSTPEGAHDVAWWQRLVPGGDRRLARRGVRQWEDGDRDAAAQSFTGAAELAPDDPRRRYDLGTALGALGDVDAAARELEAAAQGGLEASATYNLGTAGLLAQQPELAVQALRRALLAAPDDPDVKRNYELALRMLEQQQGEQQQEDEQKNQDDEDSQDRQQQSSGGDQPTPTATPQPQPGQQGARPTPTPDPSRAVFGALERAEAEAREEMLKRTPQPAAVEKDW